MIEITINEDYKSIKKRDKYTLEDFTILTGKNGSGKSHLLEAISKSGSTVNRSGTLLEKKVYIPFNSLNISVSEKVKEADITSFLRQFYDKLQNNLKDYPKNIERNAVVSNDSVGKNVLSKNEINFIHAVRDKTNLSLKELTYDIFLNNFDITYLTEQVFSSEFGLLFVNYHNRELDNKYKKFLKEQEGKEFVKYLPDDEFIKYYGIPPWDFINSIFQKLNLPFHTKEPQYVEKEQTFDFRIYNEKGLEIPFKDLSSGEKVILALAFSIYYSGNSMKKPDLLLLDEPDNSLHPSLTVKLLEVIKDEIVNKMDIPVIMTTHSPITIISSGDTPVYVKFKDFTKPKKINSNTAIEELSGDIPYLKITTDSRRQVLVENSNDVSYYEKIRNALKKIAPFSTELFFFPARTTDGKNAENGCNCADVKKFVRKFKEAGNKEIFGIIDFDNTNHAHDNIIIAGMGSRYAIDNFMLDPFIIGLYLIEEKIKDMDYFGVNSITSIYDAKNISQEDAQKIIDKILEDIGFNGGELVDYELMNGWKLKITKQFAEKNGHQLEDIYKNKYPQFKKHQNEAALKNDIADKIIDGFPEFLPKDLYLTLFSIN